MITRELQSTISRQTQVDLQIHRVIRNIWIVIINPSAIASNEELLFLMLAIALMLLIWRVQINLLLLVLRQ